MAPSFSKIPIPDIPGISAIAGLMCTDAGCGALFTNLEDWEAHTVQTHTGYLNPITCSIYEHVYKSGATKMVSGLTLSKGRAWPRWP